MNFKARYAWPLYSALVGAVVSLCLATAAGAQTGSPAKTRPAAAATAAKLPAFTYGQHPGAMAFADEVMEGTLSLPVLQGGLSP